MKMRRALTMKNKFKFVDGSIPIPDDDDDDLNWSAWQRCNNLVLLTQLHLLMHRV